MKQGSKIIVILTGIVLLPLASFATTINLGVISFDTLIPASATAGVNVFDISNLTGSFAVPPDFPAVDSVIFIGSSLTVTDSGGQSNTIALGNIGPGGLNDTTPVQFSDTSLFSSAVFAATLNPISFILSDGSTFTAGSPVLTAELLPSSGSTLMADSDFVLLTVSNATPPATVPEPGSLLLFGTGLIGFVVLKTRRSRRLG